MSDEELIEYYFEQIPKLLSQSRLSLLLGAGCSRCAGLPMMDKLTQQICEKLSPDNAENDEEKEVFKLLKDITDNYDGVPDVTIEDYLSEIQDIDAILQRQYLKGVNNPVFWGKSCSYNKSHTEILIRKIKENIRQVLGKNVSTIKYHRNFCRALHYGLRHGRERTGQPIKYFVLNYDTLIEDALALERIAYNDGFIGGKTAFWDSQIYSSEYVSDKRNFIEAIVYKLHGSIDWIKPEEADFPIRVNDTLPINEVIGQGEPVVIYPSSVKYKETQYDPFDQLLIRFRKSLGETENHVLAIMGYGFNDEHINLEIKNGLKTSKGALSIVIFLGTEELPDSLESWLRDENICSQILVLGKNGIWKDGEKILESVDDIDWFKFERIGLLLSGV